MLNSCASSAARVTEGVVQCEAAPRQFYAKSAKVPKWKVKVQFLADRSGQFGALQRLLDIKARRHASEKTVLRPKGTVSDEKVFQYERPKMEWSATRTTIGRLKGATRDFSDRFLYLLPIASIFASAELP